MRLPALAFAFVGVGCTMGSAPAEPEGATASHLDGPVARIGPVGCSLTPDAAAARGFRTGELVAGTTSIASAAPAAMVVLYNHTGTYLQLDAVAARDAPAGPWSEYCVNLDTADTYPDLIDPAKRSPGQASMGAGEVGCMFKLATETEYRPIRWGTDAQPTALAVPPGSCVFVGGAAGARFEVTAEAEQRGVFAVRQPVIDHVASCTGSPGSSPWKPWTNDTGRTLHLVGATVYAAAPESAADPTRVDTACVDVLDEAGAIRTSFCSPDHPVGARGELALPSTEIPPGWSLAAQATHACSAPALWGWATWLHVY